LPYFLPEEAISWWPSVIKAVDPSPSGLVAFAFTSLAVGAVLAFILAFFNRQKVI
jgi:hypothetical protein